MVKRLYIVRHAQAEDGYLRDVERNLTSKGIMQSAKLGRSLKEEGISIGKILSSPANRAFQTAKVLLEQYNREEDEIVVLEGLYGGGPRGYLAAINGIADEEESAAVFGHNPEITFFAEYLTRDDIQGDMKKATIIVMEFENLNWAEISGNTGKVLRRIDVGTIA